MPVPKASVHEDDLTMPFEDQIWSSGQNAIVQQISKSKLIYSSPNEQLWSGIFAFDERHPLASLALGEGVHARHSWQRLARCHGSLSHSPPKSKALRMARAPLGRIEHSKNTAVNDVTFSLTPRHRFGYWLKYLALCRAPFRTACRDSEGEVRCPRADFFANSHSGGFGSPVDRHKDRSARSVLNRGIFERSGQNSC